MNILLAALNAKYIHTSLPLLSLKKYAAFKGIQVDTAEYTINNDPKAILADIFEKKPAAVGFSCYIWNIGIIIDIAENLKKVLPEVFIFLGGPEVSFDSRKMLENFSFIDAVIRGEGEKSFALLASFLNYGTPALCEIRGLSYKESGKILENPMGEPLSPDELPFVYDSLDSFKNRILYYESQRGCPYNCRFCLSSLEGGVRFLSDERTIRDIDFFLKDNVRQVKFVDRTFNCNKRHSHLIWKHCIENDNGYTNFHMEIEAHALGFDEIEYLKNARRGLFQFEIGVQSTNPQTLAAVSRSADFESLAAKVRKIQEAKNIHVHLDLIAGLPYEDYVSFAKSFNDVFSLRPQQLQLGFLKLLKGSGLRHDADRYGIVYDKKAPYEVLFTKYLSYSDMLKLKAIEDIVETYYNSGKAVNTVFYTASLFCTPFEFFEAFASYWHKNGYHKANHGKQELYTIFYEFCLQSKCCEPCKDTIAELLKFDMLLCDDLHALYFWKYDDTECIREFRHRFFSDFEAVKRFAPELSGFSPQQLSRMCRLSLFSYDVLDYNAENPSEIKNTPTYVLFNYSGRDRITNHACAIKIKE